MNFELEGKLIKIYEVESKSASFQTREFVVETEGTYPQFIKFQLTQDKCGIMDSHKEGDKVKVSFDLRGREWQGKYFTNLNAWKVDKVAAVPASTSSQNSGDDFPPSGFEPFDGESSSGPEDFDDLPF